MMLSNADDMPTLFVFIRPKILSVAVGLVEKSEIC